MFLKVASWVLGCVLVGSTIVAAEEPAVPKAAAARLTTDELARWIDERFAAAWREAQIDPPDVVDDATFLKRAYLDLLGSIPSVSQARDFLEYTGERPRGTVVDRLLSDPGRLDKYVDRTAAHWANVWRRTMVPGNSPEAQLAVGLEPWLKEQFVANVPYDQLARKLITAKSDGQVMRVVNPRLGAYEP